MIGLDADLWWASFNTLRMIKAMPLVGGPAQVGKAESVPINIVLNEWQVQDRHLSLYQSKDHLISVMKLAILTENGCTCPPTLGN